MDKKLRSYLADIGRRGGQATGSSKRRGDPDYYRRLAKKSARSRARNKDKK